MVAGDAVAAYAEPSPDNIFASLINGGNSERGTPTMMLPDKMLLSMPRGMKDQLKQLARLKHCSMNDIVRRALQEALEVYNLWPLNGEPPPRPEPTLFIHPRSRFTPAQLANDPVAQATVTALEINQALAVMQEPVNIQDGSSIAYNPVNITYHLKRRQEEEQAKADASFNEFLTEAHKLIRKMGPGEETSPLPSAAD